MKRLIKFIFLVIFALIIGFVGGFCYRVFIKDKFKDEKFEDVFVSGELSIHFLELGNKFTGDSVYIKCGENDILIDAGSRTNSAGTIINYVDQYVEDGKLEYVIATHGHQDHIAAFNSTKSQAGIFEHYKVDTIIDFPKSDVTSAVLANYRENVEKEVEEGAKHYTALECYNEINGAKRIYQLSETVELEILYNYYYENKTSDENNYSVCVMIRQGINQYLFTGDLEKEGELKLVEYYKQNHGGLGHCVLYKAGHHGSNTSSTNELLAEITPEVVCVCCCAGSDEYTSNNDNQFPTQDFVNKVSLYTDKVFVTTMVDGESYKSMNGNIVFSVKRGEIKIECSNNNLLLKETEWFAAHRTMPSAWAA